MVAGLRELEAQASKVQKCATALCLGALSFRMVVGLHEPDRGTSLEGTEMRHSPREAVRDH
jgi:hypothetical protein